MMEDAKNLVRIAQPLIVEVRRGSGSPPSFGSEWEPLWNAKVEPIVINPGSSPSVATVWLPELRWNESPGVSAGDNVRIKTQAGTVVFAGFIASFQPSFSGAMGKVPAFERNAFIVLSYRWLFAATSPVYGQYARGFDDYDSDDEPLPDSVIFLSGQRTIFNPDGRPNCDPVAYTDPETGAETPVFIDAGSDTAEYWTTGKMVWLLLSRLYNRIYQYWPIEDPNELTGLDHEDWDKVLTDITVEGVSVIEAVELICRHIGWSFREDYGGDSPELVFYKCGDASGYVRNNSNPIILHAPYAFFPGETPLEAVERGEKILYAAEIAKDTASIINNPWGLGAPHRFEITAELIPAWLDEDLEPDSSDGYANLFVTEAALQQLTNKNEKTFFKYYHPRGDSFRRDVGRKWALNESGRYSNPNTYNRGPVFDLAAVVPEEYIISNESGKRLFAPYKRQLLPCLTFDKSNLNSIGIIVEFSFDGGETWQIIPATISSLKDECGIYIDEANLSELVDAAEATIAEGPLADVQLNYFSSLADDILNDRLFYNEQGECEWNTRVRVTASIQLDQRLQLQVAPSATSGTPFLQAQLYDFSEKYGLVKRTESSVFADSELSAFEIDSEHYLGAHLDAICYTNEGKSVSAQFTLERLWLGDDEGEAFALGDGIEKIAGREYNLSAVMAGEGRPEKIYPEIIQIIHYPEQQKTKLITRDLRFAEVFL